MSRPTAFVPKAFLQCAAGIGALCLMDAVVKHLAATHAVSLVTFARYAAGTPLAIAFWWWRGRPPITRAMLPLHLLRGMLIASMALAFYFALTKLPMAQTITLTFVAPLLVPPLAALVLKEPMQRRYVTAGLIGFAGVLVTAGGLPALDTTRLLALAAALYAAIAYAGTAVILRARAARDGADVITLLGAVVPMLLLSPFAIGAPAPDGPSLLWFLALGLIGNVGVQLLARGYAHVEAQASAVIEFTALPWAALFGWFVFGEPVAPETWAGAAIILTACIWAARPSPTAVPQGD